MQRTTNLDLILPSGEDYVNVDEQISGNFQKIDDGFGELNSKIENETYDAINIGSTTIGYVMKVGRLCIVSLTVKNATIPTTGVTLPDKYKADSAYCSMCRYYDGTNDQVGTLHIAYNSTTLYLFNLADQVTSGKYVGGTLAYFAWDTAL